jgi:enamine deaminase RidA (YjgF/YER057c/UK114 family)
MNGEATMVNPQVQRADRASGGPATLLPEGWPTPRGYANGMLAEGRFLVTGGIVGWDEHGVFADGFVAQARRTLENIRAILAAGGGEPHHLVRLTWYVVDIEEYRSNLRELGRAYRDVFGTHYPAMALVQVVRLVEPEARLEIEATAVVPTG